MRQTLSVTVQGERSKWTFNFKGDPAHLDEWRADGLEVYEVMNTIPKWVVDIGLMRPWIAVQDAWRWLRWF